MEIDLTPALCHGDLTQGVTTGARSKDRGTGRGDSLDRKDQGGTGRGNAETPLGRAEQAKDMARFEDLPHTDEPELFP